MSRKALAPIDVEMLKRQVERLGSIIGGIAPGRRLPSKDELMGLWNLIHNILDELVHGKDAILSTKKKRVRYVHIDLEQFEKRAATLGMVVEDMDSSDAERVKEMMQLKTLRHQIQSMIDHMRKGEFIALVASETKE